MSKHGTSLSLSKDFDQISGCVDQMVEPPFGTKRLIEVRDDPLENFRISQGLAGYSFPFLLLFIPGSARLGGAEWYIKPEGGPVSPFSPPSKSLLFGMMKFADFLSLVTFVIVAFHVTGVRGLKVLFERRAPIGASVISPHSGTRYTFGLSTAAETLHNRRDMRVNYLF